MEIIFTVTLHLFWLSDFVPAGFAFQNSHLVRENDGLMVSAPECTDRAVIKKGETLYALVSLCQNELTFFELSAENTSDEPPHKEPRHYKILSNETIKKNKQIDWFQTGQSNYFLLLNPSNKEMAFFYLSEKKQAYIKKFFISKNSGILFETSNRLFLVHKLGANEFRLSDLGDLLQNTSLNIPSGIANFWIPPESNALLLQDTDTSKGFYLYNLLENQWVLAPPLLLQDDEKKLLKRANALLKIELPPSTKRFYYRIFVDGTELERTRFAIEGEKILYPMKLAPGTHLVHLVKFVSEKEKNGKEYKRAKNIQQLLPISIDIKSGQKTLLFISQGKSNDAKPYYLRHHKIRD